MLLNFDPPSGIIQTTRFCQGWTEGQFFRPNAEAKAEGPIFCNTTLKNLQLLFCVKGLSFYTQLLMV